MTDDDDNNINDRRAVAFPILRKKENITRTKYNNYCVYVCACVYE